MFSCFDNFVPSNECGVPLFLSKHDALKHLQELVKSSLDHIHTCNEEEVHPNFYCIYVTIIVIFNGNKF